MFVAGLRTTGGVGVTADLHLEDLQGRAVGGLEQVVQNLAALRFRIVDQQPAVAAATADGADAVERPTGRRAVDGDRGRGLGRRGIRERDTGGREDDPDHRRDCSPRATKSDCSPPATKSDCSPRTAKRWSRSGHGAWSFGSVAAADRTEPSNGRAGRERTVVVHGAKTAGARGFIRRRHADPRSENAIAGMTASPQNMARMLREHS